MRNNETEACKICRMLSDDKDNPQCEYYNSGGAGNACLSKDRAIIVLLHEILKSKEE